jgi:hypothetical protein
MVNSDYSAHSMTDITNPKLLWLKAALFLAIGIIAAILLLLDMRQLRDAILLVLAIWAFCRAYYFAFYVIEHYIDGRFKFSGLVSVAAHVFDRRNRSRRDYMGKQADGDSHE